MAFKAHKKFFDASVFLGMRRDDYAVRNACDRRIAVRRHRYRGLLFSEQRRLLLKSLAIELRADLDEAQRPKAQPPLETSVAVIGGLNKAFDDYERSGL
jgi:hypothetical protein